MRNSLCGLLVATVVSLGVPLAISSAFFPPTVSSVNIGYGEVLFNRHCSACHATHPSAKIGLGPNLSNIGTIAATRRPGISGAQYLLESILEPEAFEAPGGAGLMPADTAAGLSKRQIRHLVGYLASLGSKPDYFDIARLRIQLPSLPGRSLATVDLEQIARGRRLFDDAGCSKCHSIYAEPGHDLIAPSLARAGQLPEEHLRQSILEPDAVIYPGYEQATLTTIDGREIRGRIIAQTRSELTVLTVDQLGGRRSERIPAEMIPKSPEGDPALTVSNKALMPAFPLSSKDLDDLVAFLRMVAGSSTGGW